MNGETPVELHAGLAERAQEREPDLVRFEQAGEVDAHRAARGLAGTPQLLDAGADKATRYVHDRGVPKAFLRDPQEHRTPRERI